MALTNLGEVGAEVGEQAAHVLVEQLLRLAALGVRAITRTSHYCFHYGRYGLWP